MLLVFIQMLVALWHVGSPSGVGRSIGTIGRYWSGVLPLEMTGA
jgi:hypothetical protein